MLTRRRLLRGLLAVPLVGLPAVRAVAEVAPRTRLGREALLELLERRMAEAQALMRRQVEENWWRQSVDGEQPLDAERWFEEFELVAEAPEVEPRWEWRQVSVVIDFDGKVL